MNAPRQRYMQIIGESGCYLLCYVHIGEIVLGHRIDAVEIYERAIEPTWWMADGSRGQIITEECYVNDAAKLMELVAGEGEWTVEHTGPDHMAGPDEWEILRLEWVRTTGKLSHFVIGGCAVWDPLGDSLTARYGVLVSKRIVRRIG